jgi:EAL domain-containing protein (putative c-di-GMP-specific phosphodiesterase class I)
MRTLVSQETAAKLPWLEYYSPESGSPETTVLEKFPFTIGRNDSADLQIPSSRVSREHALILREGNRFRVRDLESTNGTFLNGARIQEAWLHDGDLLVVADVEFTFFSGQGDASRATVTQVMAGGPSGASPGDIASQLIRSVRRMQETVVQRSTEILFHPVVDLKEHRPVGYAVVEEPESAEPGRSEAERILAAAECRLTGRIRQLRRVMAAEQFASAAGPGRLLVEVHGSEMGSEGLIESLCRLRHVLADDQNLVVQLPDSAVSDNPYTRQLLGRLRAMGAAIAFADFAAGHGQVAQQAEIRPDLILLARALVRDLRQTQERRQQVAAVARAAGEIGCHLIATGIQDEHDAALCGQLGCRYGQGDHFGRPAPIGLLARCDRRDAPSAVEDHGRRPASGTGPPAAAPPFSPSIELLDAALEDEGTC